MTHSGYGEHIGVVQDACHRNVDVFVSEDVAWAVYHLGGPSEYATSVLVQDVFDDPDQMLFTPFALVAANC